MEKILKWLNGKKTVIGCAFLLISKFFTETGVGADEATVQTIIEVCDWIGMVLGGTGLIHRGMKTLNK